MSIQPHDPTPSVDHSCGQADWWRLELQSHWLGFCQLAAFYVGLTLGTGWIWAALDWNLLLTSAHWAIDDYAVGLLGTHVLLAPCLVAVRLG